MTSENTRNDVAAQTWLDRAAGALDEAATDLAFSDYIQAAAMIGFGYSQLAHLDDQRANRDDDLDAFEARRAEDLARIAAADRRVIEHYELIEERQQREIGLLDLQKSLSKALAKREGIDLGVVAPSSLCAMCGLQAPDEGDGQFCKPCIVACHDHESADHRCAICRDPAPLGDIVEVPVPCPRCEGCGQLASTPDREPWTAWENLPPGSDLAVVAGLVKPIQCDECDGTKQVLRRAAREAGRG